MIRTALACLLLLPLVTSVSPAAEPMPDDPIPALIAKAKREAGANQMVQPPGDNLAETLGDILANLDHASNDELVEIGKLKDLATAPKPAPQDDTRARDLYARGDAAEKTGDVVTARRYYRAGADAYAPSALALGRLYDPAYLATLQVVGGVSGDTSEARRWYERAATLGDKDAGKLAEEMK